MRYSFKDSNFLPDMRMIGNEILTGGEKFWVAGFFFRPAISQPSSGIGRLGFFVAPLVGDGCLLADEGAGCKGFALGGTTAASSDCRRFSAAFFLRFLLSWLLLRCSIVPRQNKKMLRRTLSHTFWLAFFFALWQLAISSSSQKRRQR